jgi:general secretion pathway protein K
MGQRIGKDWRVTPIDGSVSKDSGGFALIIVLWGLVVIGLLITHLTATGRTEAKIAANMISNAEAATAADGGIATAIFYLSQSDDRLRWASDGRAHAVKIGSAVVSVRCWSESGKINPNLASDALMSALLQEMGVSASKAETLAAAIGGWHDPTRQARPGGGGPGEYAAAGLNYGPPGSPIEKINELSRVLGMTPELFAALRPHLSLWNQLAVPAAPYADEIVARAMGHVANKAATTSSPIRPSITATIVAIGKASSGASFFRRAVVVIAPELEKGYQILLWDTGSED